MDNIAGLFDSISGTYDRFNHLLSLNIDRRWRRRAVREMTPCYRLLDVATGTADLALEVVRQDKASVVKGIDISREMISIGRKKVEKSRKADRITLLEGSALDIPFGDGSFDALTCAYGVRNFSDLDRGLGEMERVLRSGGELMILEFSYPSNPFVRFLYDFYFTVIMPRVGRLLSHNENAYLYFRDSVKGFIWGEEMVSKLSSAGFSDIRWKSLSCGITTVYYARKK